MRPAAALAAVLVAVALVMAPLRAAAETAPATLIADRVFLASRTLLIAEGNVEVMYRDARLKAARIVYDRAADRLTIAGPIVLTRGEAVVVLADAAELTPDLTEGLMASARIVLNRQLQLAAADLMRTGGRYSRLRRVVATSCRVCADRPVPLWEIRAAEVVHDAAARQLHFRSAQFRLAGVPVLWLPWLRMPDPTLKRATGFLLPSIRTTSTLGTGIRLPYFIALGPSRDLLLTPYISTDRTRTLQFRYRQALRNGGFGFQGAVSRDDLQPGATRGYIFGAGALTLGRGWGLSFRLEAVSDPTYLADYGLGRRDRLTSGITLERVRRDEIARARLLGFRSLRPGEGNSTLPAAMAEWLWERRFDTPVLGGGSAGLRLQGFGVLRPSEADGPGRDTGRLSLRLDWQRTAVFGPGLVARVEAVAAGELHAVAQDSAFPGRRGHLAPTLAAELRWPLVRRAADGGESLLEPVAQIAWSPPGTRGGPNEDGAIVELDEGNLFALSRFPGGDAAESGLRANLGLLWRHRTASGWSGGLALGRVLRTRADAAFSPGSGLSGRSSDWFLAADAATPGGGRLAARALVGDDLEVSRGELRLSWPTTRMDLSTGVVWLAADPAENRPAATAEWTVDAAVRLNANWTGRFNTRYDFETDRATEAGLGLVWRNECVVVDLSVTRRFTSSASVEPATDFSLTVGLVGFGGTEEAGPPTRSCTAAPR